MTKRQFTVVVLFLAVIVGLQVYQMTVQYKKVRKDIEEVYYSVEEVQGYVTRVQDEIESLSFKTDENEHAISDIKTHFEIP